MSKKSIRFYKDHEVRAIWDEEQSQWWFSIVDIVAAVTESPNPRKYWSVLKTRLKKTGNELTTRCSQLKMTAADGKRYATDCFAQDDIIKLIRVIPSPKTADFLDWFVYSDNTIDGQSKKKAYTLIESGVLETMKPGCLAVCMTLPVRYEPKQSRRATPSSVWRNTCTHSSRVWSRCHKRTSMRLWINT